MSSIESSMPSTNEYNYPILSNLIQDKILTNRFTEITIDAMKKCAQLAYTNLYSKSRKNTIDSNDILHEIMEYNGNDTIYYTQLYCLAFINFYQMKDKLDNINCDITVKMICKLNKIYTTKISNILNNSPD